MHGDGGDSGLGEVRRHEISVGDGAAETEGAAVAMFSPSVETFLSTFVGLEGGREGECVEFPVTPRDWLKVNRVLEAPVMERNKFMTSDAFDEVALEDEVVIAERQEIRTIHPFRCGGKT